MTTNTTKGMLAKPLNQHDLEHRNIRLQLFVLRQLVLRQYAAEYGERAPEVVRERLAEIRDAERDGGLHAAEQAMLMDETAEVLAEVDEHLELVQLGAL
ncbi:hypothetical protein HTY52_12980 [Cupriavidus taiwanensis]|uniref:hypothetical protein n=1 Tax=Cupriavidus taiwanensis TaxID=164546 RepID=UPI0015746770|nr:hypothetical protein [Cupriavidus taiwanensis]NSX14990.1 hypothetical protein [Cupriavidus taiwanensis]